MMIIWHKCKQSIQGLNILASSLTHSTHNLTFTVYSVVSPLCLYRDTRDVYDATFGEKEPVYFLQVWYS